MLRVLKKSRKIKKSKNLSGYKKSNNYLEFLKNLKMLEILKNRKNSEINKQNQKRINSEVGFENRVSGRKNVFSFYKIKKKLGIKNQKKLAIKIKKGVGNL